MRYPKCRRIVATRLHLFQLTTNLGEKSFILIIDHNFDQNLLDRVTNKSQDQIARQAVIAEELNVKRFMSGETMIIDASKMDILIRTAPLLTRNSLRIGILVFTAGKPYDFSTCLEKIC